MSSNSDQILNHLKNHIFLNSCVNIYKPLYIYVIVSRHMYPNPYKPYANIIQKDMKKIVKTYLRNVLH